MGIAGTLAVSWIIVSIWYGVKDSSARLSGGMDVDACYQRLRLGMGRHEALRMVGRAGRESRSCDGSGEWRTIRWYNGQSKCLRATFHNDCLVDWALY